MGENIVQVGCDLGPRDAPGPPVVMIHGASSNLGTMRPVGDLLAKNHRVILIDRPGHGWSTRDDLENSTPANQATTASRDRLSNAPVAGVYAAPESSRAQQRHSCPRP